MSVVAPDRLKERAEQYADRNDATLPEVLGRFRLDPDDESEERALVEAVLAGEAERANATSGAADVTREAEA